MGGIIVIKKRAPHRVQFIEHIQRHFIIPASLATAEIADAYLGMLKEAIYNERFKAELQPLSDRYLKDKMRNSHDQRMFIRTGFFVEHLGVRKQNDPNKRRYVYAIGFPDQLKVPGSDLTAGQLARILEKGNSRIPARPIFQKVGNMFFAMVLDREGYVRKKILSKIPKASRDFGRWPASIYHVNVGPSRRPRLRKRKNTV